jgi:hypothetical protein
MCPLLDQGWPIAFYNLSYLGHLLQWWKCGKKGALLRPAESLKYAYMSIDCSFSGGSSGNPACANWWITGSTSWFQVDQVSSLDAFETP